MAHRGSFLAVAEPEAQIARGGSDVIGQHRGDSRALRLIFELPTLTTRVLVRIWSEQPQHERKQCRHVIEPTAAERNATFQRLQHAAQRHGVGLVLVFSINAHGHPWFIAPQDCIALLPSSFSMTTSIQGRSCKDDVSSERPVPVLSSKEHVAPPLALEILQGNRQQIYPILLLQSVAHLSNTSGQTMVLSSLESSALMRSRTRVMTKHLNAVSWSARVSFLTAVNTQY